MGRVKRTFYEPYGVVNEAITNGFYVFWEEDTRLNLLRPKEGWYLRGYIYQMGLLWGGDNHFVRFRWEGARFLNLKDFTLALHGAFIITLSFLPPEMISLDERFTLGGANTLRGYEEKSLGVMNPFGERDGVQLVLVNIEMHYALHPLWELVFFGDAGYLGMDFLPQEWDEEIGISPGVGLRFFTPIGPVRGGYAFPIVGEDVKGRFYIAFGTPF